MQALDDLVRRILLDAGFDEDTVIWNTPERNQRSPFILYWASDSGPDTAMTAMGTEARSYEYTILAIATTSDLALEFRDKAEDALIAKKLTVAGWKHTGKTAWNGDTHDPGDRLPSGQVVLFDGFKVSIRLQRPAR